MQSGLKIGLTLRGCFADKWEDEYEFAHYDV